MSEDSSLQKGFAESGATPSFTQKAFREVEGLFALLGADVPPILYTIAKDAHAAIDSYIDRPEADKECLKALAAIELGHTFIGHPYLFDDMTRYETLYSPQFSNMAFDFMRHNDTQDTVQVDMALAYASLQLQLAAFQNPKTIEIIDVEDTVATYTVELMNLENYASIGAAPRLLDKIKEATEQAIQALRLSKQQGPNNDPVLKL